MKKEIGRMFEERKLNVLGLRETKMIGEGESSFREIRELKSGTGRRGRERRYLPILLSGHAWRCVKEVR